MKPLLLPEQMAAADRATIDAGTPAETLMDRAGRGTAGAVLRLAGHRYGTRVVLLCGKGNNGGDGFVAARVLGGEGVAAARLLVDGAPALGGPAAHHLELARRRGVRVDTFTPDGLSGADVVVDALVGTGFKGSTEGLLADAIGAINDNSAVVVAADIPSGVDGATGAAPGPAVRADVTVAFGAAKIGTCVGPGAVLAGEVEVVDIGIEVPASQVSLLEGDDVRRALPGRALDSHKKSRGAVALMGGSSGMSGAVALAVRGAMRAGAGYVSVGTTLEVERVISQLVPESVKHVLSEGDTLSLDGLKRFADVLEVSDAVALGPGLGVGHEQQSLVDELMRRVSVPLVIDADGLNVLEDHLEGLKQRSAPTVLTPHPAELARLMGSDVSQVQLDRVSAARAAASDLGSIVVLKGYRTVVAAPSGEVVICPTGGAELATAGTGDVLTGVVAALIAGGLDPFSAAWCAVWLHGEAGDRVRSGAVAWDVAEAIRSEVTGTS